MTDIDPKLITTKAQNIGSLDVSNKEIVNEETINEDIIEEDTLEEDIIDEETEDEEIVEEDTIEEETDDEETVSEETANKEIINEEFHENGKLQRQSILKNGLLHGTMKEFDENGMCVLVSNFHQGKLQGITTVFA